MFPPRSGIAEYIWKDYAVLFVMRFKFDRENTTRERRRLYETNKSQWNPGRQKKKKVIVVSCN